MPEPEIARRCHACGASIRDRAFFCPQCGTQLQDETKALENFDLTIRETAESNRPAAAETARIEAPTLPLQRPGGSAPAYGTHKKTDAAPAEARDGIVGQRVEKLRKMSSVVLDQAAYDPSLRFLLVAGFLFLVFVVILIMSKLIT